MLFVILVEVERMRCTFLHSRGVQVVPEYLAARHAVATGIDGRGGRDRVDGVPDACGDVLEVLGSSAAKSSRGIGNLQAEFRCQPGGEIEREGRSQDASRDDADQEARSTAALRFCVCHVLHARSKLRLRLSHTAHVRARFRET